MRAAIDGRIIFRRGVGRYTANLVKNLIEVSKQDEFYVYLDKNSVLTDFIRSKNLKFKRLNTANPLYYEQFLLPKQAQKDKCSVLHCTDNKLPVFSRAFKGKKIVTIHDTMFVRPISMSVSKPTVKQRAVDAYLKTVIPASAKQADAVITVSEYSKNDIIKRIGTEPDKISVITEGVEPKYKEIKESRKITAAKSKFGLSKPFILMTAASDLRKNFDRAIEAFNLFNNMTEYKYQLVITSIGAEELKTTKIPEKIKSLNLEKYVTITGYVSDDEMIALYNTALFFLFPSIWEGFGLQVLEAFACGLPVICASNTSLGEVAGDAAMAIDPYSVEDITRAMTELEKSEAKRAQLKEKGFRQAEKFSWKEAAQKTLELYKKTAGVNDGK